MILEGIDGVGKTTKALRHLDAKDFDVYIHASGSTPNTFEWHLNLLHQFENKAIYDRFFIGEWVWSKVFERTCKLTDDQIRELLIYCKAYNIKIVYAYNENWKDVLIERGEEDQIATRIKALTYYKIFFQEFGVEYETYDWKTREEE